MGKARKKPYTPPPQGDVGPDTAAQRNGAEILNMREDCGVVFRRKTKHHALDIMARKGTITVRQCKAGIKLHKLYAITEMGPDAAFTRVAVDTSPDWDAQALSKSERQAAFVALFRHVPAELKGPVWHTAIKGKQLRAGYSRDGHEAQHHTRQLMTALDLVANEMGI